MVVASRHGMVAIRKILVPVDFSPCSRAALVLALALAKPFGASVHVLYVWKPPDSLRSRLVDVAEDAVGAAVRELKAFIADAADASQVALHHTVEIGEPVERILEDAEEGKYDMVVLGTHGRAERTHRAGGVAQTIVGRAPCPVLTVQAPKLPAVRTDPPA